MLPLATKSRKIGSFITLKAIFRTLRFSSEGNSLKPSSFNLRETSVLDSPVTWSKSISRKLLTSQEFQLKFVGLLKGISDKYTFRNHPTTVFPQCLSCLVKKKKETMQIRRKQKKYGWLKLL